MALAPPDIRFGFDRNLPTVALEASLDRNWTLPVGYVALSLLKQGVQALLFDNRDRDGVTDAGLARYGVVRPHQVEIITLPDEPVHPDAWRIRKWVPSQESAAFHLDAGYNTREFRHFVTARQRVRAFVGAIGLRQALIPTIYIGKNAERSLPAADELIIKPPNSSHGSASAGTVQLVDRQAARQLLQAGALAGKIVQPRIATADPAQLAAVMRAPVGNGQVPPMRGGFHTLEVYQPLWREPTSPAGALLHWIPNNPELLGSYSQSRMIELTNPDHMFSGLPDLGPTHNTVTTGLLDQYGPNNYAIIKYIIGATGAVYVEDIMADRLDIGAVNYLLDPEVDRLADLATQAHARRA